VAAPTAGVIASFPAREGDEVRKGTLLFTQADAQQKALADAAAAQADSARATWQNLTTGGRAEELAAAQAAVNKAKADLDLAQQTFTRSQKLVASNTVTQAQLDQDSAAMQSAEAALNQAEAQLAVTALPGREQQQKSAEAGYRAAQANSAKAVADLADRTVKAPADGRIERTYYNPGEVAPAGTPVLSLLPSGALKVAFYVGEADRMKLTIGQKVTVACDGCPPGLGGEVSFLASEPQFTSPIIYSRDQRSQLVFLAEARLPSPGNILPGQPVTVSLAND
jgi:HlyD family secretion protein